MNMRQNKNMNVKYFFFLLLKRRKKQPQTLLITRTFINIDTAINPKRKCNFFLKIVMMMMMMMIHQMCFSYFYKTKTNTDTELTMSLNDKRLRIKGFLYHDVGLFVFCMDKKFD